MQIVFCLSPVASNSTTIPVSNLRKWSEYSKTCRIKWIKYFPGIQLMVTFVFRLLIDLINQLISKTANVSWLSVCSLSSRV